jgi:hypothetical protein
MGRRFRVRAQNSFILWPPWGALLTHAGVLLPLIAHMEQSRYSEPCDSSSQVMDLEQHDRLMQYVVS